eukprot:5801636-Amphidinium_carterae.1
MTATEMRWAMPKAPRQMQNEVAGCEDTRSQGFLNSARQQNEKSPRPCTGNKELENQEVQHKFCNVNRPVAVKAMSFGRGRCRSNASDSKSFLILNATPPRSKSSYSPTHLSGLLATHEVERLKVHQQGQAFDVTRHLPNARSERGTHTM